MAPKPPKSSITCHNCGYDGNSITAIRCDLCKQPLELNYALNSNSTIRNSVYNSKKTTRYRFYLPNTWLTLVSILSLLLGGSLFFWRSQSVSTQNFQRLGDRGNSKAIVILGDTFSGYSTFRSDRLRQALKEFQIEAHYKDEFNQARRARLLNEGQADFLVTTLDQFLKQKPQGKIVGLINHTIGGDAVVLNTKQYPNLRSLQALNQLVQQRRSQNQLSIIFAGDSPSEYLGLLLDAKFEAFRLLDFQTIKVVDAADAWKQLQSNSNLAAAILWEPFVTKARQQGYTVVLSSRDTPGAIVDVIVAGDRLLQSQPEKISAFLEAYYRLIDTSTSDRLLLQNQIARDGNLSASDATTVMQGIDFFTSVEAKNWMRDGTLEKRINSTAAVLALTGRMKQVPPAPQNLFTYQFLDRAASHTQKLISSIRSDNPKLADSLLEGVANDTNSKFETASNLGNLRVQGEIEFQFGSTTLTRKGKQTLDRLAKQIAEFNSQTVAIRVIGHTSRKGLADLNQKLSQQRAQEVVNYLKQRGLQHKMSAVGKGFSQLRGDISPYDNRNQRTEIQLLRLKS
jgi:OmpA-OmpF porin, OOP family